MPIKIPNSLPATSVLESENIFVMTERIAIQQDIRPLKLLILNLMPTKIITETQLLRQLSNTPLQIEVEFLTTASYESKNTDKSHLDTFYATLGDVLHKRYDGMIITGAPVGDMPFENVSYWDELTEIMRWTSTNVHCTLHICWGALAGLYLHYGIPKLEIPGGKLSGVYEHKLLMPNSPLFRGFDDTFYMPHSRYYCADQDKVYAHDELDVMSISDAAGIFALKSRDNRRFFFTGHAEYDGDTLKKEYERDAGRGLNPAMPENYFPHDNPTLPPIVRWRAHAQLLFSNWLNYYVYQETPYDLSELPEVSAL